MSEENDKNSTPEVKKPEEKPAEASQPADNTEKAADTGSTPKTAPAAKPAPAKKISTEAVIAIVVIALFAVVGGVATNKAMKTVDLTDCVTVKYDGYDGYGTASAEFDTAKFAKEGKHLKLKSKAAQEFIGDLYDSDEEGVADVVDMCVDVKLDKSNGLSNGDKITYKVDLDSDAKRIIDGTLKTGSKTIKVSGLKKAEKFDVFKDIDKEIVFKGVNGGGSAVGAENTPIYESTLTLKSGLTVKLSKTSGLSNGDKVEVSISPQSVSQFASEKGKVPKKSKTTMKVSGLVDIPDSAAKYTADDLADMISQAKDTLTSHMSDDFDYPDNLTINSVDYIGNYYLVKKDLSTVSPDIITDSGKLTSQTDSWWEEESTIADRLYLVFKITGTYTNDDGSVNATFYEPVRYLNVSLENGKPAVENLTGASVSDNGAYAEIDTGLPQKYSDYTLKISMPGYLSTDAIKEKIVNPLVADYSSEENING